jgi:hypothetical protein
MIGINIQKPKRLLSHAVAARGLEEHYHLQNVIFLREPFDRFVGLVPPLSDEY